MGRDAKLRRQRREQHQEPTESWVQPSATSSERSPFQNLEEFDQVEVPAIAPATPASEAKPRSSWLQRLLPSKHSASDEPYSSGQEIGKFFDAYQTMLGAIAWHGYKTQGRGFVLAKPTEHDTVHLRYVSRKTLNQFIQPEKRAVCRQAIESYEPQTEVLLVTVTSAGDLVLNAPRATEPPPQACYQQGLAQE